MTEWINIYDRYADRRIANAYFNWTNWADEQNAKLNKKKKTKGENKCQNNT
tara:strand:- start:608 stop:760 length:153 start_codon:yes stop_codon:yes gene_type:complete